MRVVDCFTNVILYARHLTRHADEVNATEASQELGRLLDKSSSLAEEHAIPEDVFMNARFPVVAYVDELLLCLNWPGKSEWQKNPLQRIHFGTTNAGAEFYDRLNTLNKFGPDRDVREVYALCLGLGFRGKYFRGEDRKAYEEVKAFNLGLLLPDEAQKNIDSATLFPFAYKGHADKKESSFKARISIYPVIIGVPLAVITAMVFTYHFYIGSVLTQIYELIKY